MGILKCRPPLIKLSPTSGDNSVQDIGSQVKLPLIPVLHKKHTTPDRMALDQCATPINHDQTLHLLSEFAEGTMKSNEKNGLYYRTKGNGPLVVMLHGLLMDGESWHSNGLVDALSQKFCVAYPDMLGHGMSDKPSEASRYEQERQASNINQLINSLGYSQAHIIGYSSGGWLAAGLVKYYPKSLSSLIIGGWDVENGLPEGPNGKLDFDTFFAYAKFTAPELTDGITSDTESAVRAYFNAISLYDGFYDSALLSQINIPKLFWAGLEDIYYRQLNSWSNANECTFISVAGDHVSAILKLESALIHKIFEFVTQAEFR